jgi:hypothetical protein
VTFVANLSVHTTACPITLVVRALAPLGTNHQGEAKAPSDVLQRRRFPEGRFASNAPRLQPLGGKAGASNTSDQAARIQCVTPRVSQGHRFTIERCA